MHRRTEERTLNGIASLADQFLVSGSRFAIAIVIAKSCGATELGVYALVLTFVLMALTVQQTLITTPFANFKNRVDADEQAAYLATIFRASILLSVLTSLALLVTAIGLLIVGSDFQMPASSQNHVATFGWTMLGAAFATTPMMLAEFFRRICFIEMKAVRSLALDAGITAGLAVAIAMLWNISQINAMHVYLVAACVYGIFATAGLTFLARQMTFANNDLRATLSRHWKFGRWIVGSEAMGLGRSHLIQWIIGGFLGIGATGIFSACHSLMRATNPFMLGIANVAEPALARKFASAGPAEVRRLALRIFRIMFAVTLPLCLLIAVFSRELLSVIYKPEFSEHWRVVVWLAAAAFVAAISYPLSNSIQAIDRPRINFNIRLAGLLIVVLLSLLLIPLLNLQGAAISAFVGSAFTFGCRVYLFRKYFGADALIDADEEASNHELD